MTWCCNHTETAAPIQMISIKMIHPGRFNRTHLLQPAFKKLAFAISVYHKRNCYLGGYQLRILLSEISESAAHLRA